MRGILSSAVILNTTKSIIAFPTGSQVEITSNDDWYHDVQDADIDEALDRLEKS